MKKQIIIVAGGKGLRMGGEIPKQFLPVNGKPVLMLTLETFYRFDPQIKIILVLPREQQTYWNELCVKYHFEIPYLLADGGETRFHSVKNGLSMADDDGLIGIHDGVRPFVSQEVIAHCFDAASTKEAAIPVIDVVETVRKIDGEESVTVDRNSYKLVQTPQVFTSSLLKRAYNQEYSPLFTDDASVVEAMGIKVVLVPGNRENIKITTPFDMIIANALVNV
ncbi:2-C-methyl-D-erythritol 4-phosphate cytidylyltransferase [uncultured Bacteroides sp.]|uniref:2-C-methyl-D-erythritol 4-phosphate cytidylyltransferase n=1 Tax=uncultured Bacteroides sp. TaxID=162156 RepID=UPI002AA830C6|nr:2-C-methyl-D-erythritol 4-phosphate cytidylyltransferase [uncultured Bacteroides sp.]